MNADAMAEFERRYNGNDFNAQFGKACFWIGHVLSIEAMTRETRGDTLRILDFGCGSGDFLAHAAQCGAEVYGVDASPDRRKWADRARAIIEPSLDELPADSKGKMDAITLFEVLEHLDAPRDVLLELAQWVKPGGLLVLETPNAGHVSQIVTPLDYHLIHPIDHINAFSPETLARIAKETGFEPVNRQFGFTSTSLTQSVKREAKRALSSVRKPSTQQYFRKMA
jgi:2-polyprenyl-3-methyl-5-hydroxy-6-metoxy-1,4-benzoquinol methylase